MKNYLARNALHTYIYIYISLELVMIIKITFTTIYVYLHFWLGGGGVINGGGWLSFFSLSSLPINCTY